MAETVVLESPAAPVSMTFTPGTTAPLSSVTWPRRLTVWANAGKPTRMMATKRRNQLTYVILTAMSEDYLKVRPHARATLGPKDVSGEPQCPPAPGPRRPIVVPHAIRTPVLVRRALRSVGPLSHRSR